MRIAMVFGLVLTACGPVPVAQAERDCRDEARLAQQPRGEAKLGIDSDGRLIRRLEVDISSDYVLGRDPQKVWQSCVLNRSGQLPTRPYSSL
ncbi:MAG: hypothetical protein Q7J44_15165 [Pseudotabrizicola sp.]|uniref:hypothetical protein n=1 Tax=Pseudotabrizicola sp. TaxID=2939647 RepID=UPI0027176F31|nr:hypothetical protein [Pseudotabrizicola sp.]MDO9639876.1 hypothetical protein [Pseudotabrizicola sp.]